MKTPITKRAIINGYKKHHKSGLLRLTKSAILL